MKSFQIYFLRGPRFNRFQNSNFKIKYFELTRFLQGFKKLQKCRSHTFTNNGVFWKILKLIKIRDQGMESQLFVLCFEICIGGVSLKIGARFLRFSKMVLFVNTLQI